MNSRSHPVLSKNFCEFTAENPDKKIVEVRLAVGEFSHVEEEQLTFCYNAVITETPLAGSILTIEKIEAAVECPHCSYQRAAKIRRGLVSQNPVATIAMSSLRESRPDGRG